MTKMLDNFTFGNTPAAIVLVDVLNKLQDSRQQRSVSRFLQMHGNIRREFLNGPYINDKFIGNLFVGWWSESIRSAKLVGLDPKVENYMKNVAFSKLPTYEEFTKNRNYKM